MTTRKDLEIARAVAELLQPAIRQMVDTALAPLKSELAGIVAAGADTESSIKSLLQRLDSVAETVSAVSASCIENNTVASRTAKDLEATASTVVSLGMRVESLTGRVATTLEDVRADAKSARESAEYIAAKHTEVACTSAVTASTVRELQSRIDKVAADAGSNHEVVVQDIAKSSIAVASVREGLNTLAAKLVETEKSVLAEAVAVAKTQAADMVADESGDLLRVIGSASQKTEALAKELAELKDKPVVPEHFLNTIKTLTADVEVLKAKETPAPHDDSALVAEVKELADKVEAVAGIHAQTYTGVYAKLDTVQTELRSLDTSVKEVRATQSTVVPVAPYDDTNIREELASLKAQSQVFSSTLKGAATEIQELYDVVKSEVGAIGPKVTEAAAAIKLPDPVPGPEGTLRAVLPHTPSETVEALALRSFLGGVWQAKRETTDEPSLIDSDDWNLVVNGLAGIDIQTSDNEVKFVMLAADGTQVEKSMPVEHMTYAGVYDPAVEYRKNTAVTYAGSLWVSKVKTLGAQPGSSGGDWQLAVKRGADGKSVKGDAGEAHVAGFAGEYTTGKQYLKNSVVPYAGSVWLAKRTTKEIPPYVTREDNDDWLRIR